MNMTWNLSVHECIHSKELVQAFHFKNEENNNNYVNWDFKGV